MNRKEKIAVTGLGYVGLPVALSFARFLNVIGYDCDKGKIEQYKAGCDITREVGDELLKKTEMVFTSNEEDIRNALVHIIAVPTSVASDNTPDLTKLKEACHIVGRNLREGAVVIFESTVYPGVTEDICLPLLEDFSGMKCGEDFKLAYSPERINPGDKEHRLEKVTKVVSAIDEETLQFVSDFYGLVVESGIYKAPSIKVAEAVKLVENAQRDINIAFMNELSAILHANGIDTSEVIEAASTKWNFMNYKPGLVGGHCVGMASQYLMHSATESGINSKFVRTGREVNEGMGRYVAENVAVLLNRTGKCVQGSKVAILGVTFKEDCPDVRNSKVFDIVSKLREYGIKPLLYDPIADAEQVESLYNEHLEASISDHCVDAVVIAVAHSCFREIKYDRLMKLYGNGKHVLIDLKGCLDKNEYEGHGYQLWRL